MPIPLLAADPPEPNPECTGVRLRGTITEVAISQDRTAIRVMATWVMLDPNLPVPANIGVGDRVDVHGHAAAVARIWLVDSIDAWSSEHDELNGRIEAVDVAPDGQMRWRVLDTWVIPADVTVSRP